jgi:transcriptional regulator with XRE-family HTH domain
VAVASEANPIRERRLRSGLTQQELATRAGCAYSTIRIIEQGWNAYSPDLASRIARALGCESLDQLV